MRGRDLQLKCPGILVGSAIMAFLLTATGTVSFEIPFQEAGLAEVFHATLSRQTAQPGKLSEKISAGLGMILVFL